MLISELITQKVKWGSSDPKGFLWYYDMLINNKVYWYEARWSQLKLVVKDKDLSTKNKPEVAIQA